MSVTWSPNVFTVRLNLFMTFGQIQQRLRSLEGVDSVGPDVDDEAGLDQTQAQQQDAMLAALKQLNCEGPITTPIDPPFFP